MLLHWPDWPRRVLASLPMLAPSSCALCGKSGADAVCGGCHEQFFRAQPERCVQCAIPLPESGGTHCGACLKRPPAFDRTIVAADYAPPVDQLVLALKFGSRLALAPLFARLLRDALLHMEPDKLPAVLAPVPLGAHRLSERGFNQALEIAKPLSRSLGIELAPRLVLRARDTEAQSLLHPDQRHSNIRHAFLVPGAAIEQVKGRHVGVVDDVMTTGETLNELAATLKRFGAVRVTNFVFARTLLK
jgi:ComF family protein